MQNRNSEGSVSEVTSETSNHPTESHLSSSSLTVDDYSNNVDSESVFDVPSPSSEVGERGNVDDELVLDISGKNVECSLVENLEDSLDGLYLYKNVFNLIPNSVGGFKQLRTLKFFGNEVNLFPSEFGDLVGLECLQLKVSPPVFGGLPLHKLKGLKELELSKVPPRPSAFPILSEIAGLECLTKLSVCHFSIRYLPSEIGCLKKLENLDLSFNKMKSLPTEIGNLSALILLKVSNNKLMELPPTLSSLQRLEVLDLSNNRLTSLGSLELHLMHKLQILNLQYNKLFTICQIPSWIRCKMEGNGRDPYNEDFVSSSVEMDVYDSVIQEHDGSLSHKGSNHGYPSLLSGPASNIRCFSTRKSGKRWKRRDYFQQKARQERLNNSRKQKCVSHSKLSPSKENEDCKADNVEDPDSESCIEDVSEIIGLVENRKGIHGEGQSESLANSVKDTDISSKDMLNVENCSCASLESTEVDRKDNNNASDQDDGTSSEISNSNSKWKRHSDRDLDSPKPRKSRRAVVDCARLSHKYSVFSFCSIEDRIPDGFYDAGRERPFLPLSSYEQNFHLDSREVILVDRERDEDLDAIAHSAQGLLFRLKQLHNLIRDGDWVDELQIASLLALFVSDHFGGSDRGSIVERTRKDISGSNYRKPFVCTCSTGNSYSRPTKPADELLAGIVLSDLCEKSLRSIKERRNSIVVPLGALQFGVCRHRALLLKYLCDRVDPPVPCELVRGYLDFMPHAWNIILVKRGNSRVRMVVDACHPHDIREETDPEYHCRYIPLSRSKVPLSSGSWLDSGCSFPSLSSSDEIMKSNSTSLVLCKYGSVEAVAKVRTMELFGASGDDARNFEFGCLGEVRMLEALKHSCIVEMYGHRISSKWISSVDGKSEGRLLQYAILMEYIKGGTLKRYIEKLSRAGQKHVPVETALCIARDVACALAEVHSKHVIHRDIKSENILINVDRKLADGMPSAKLCDFDRAVPLRSLLHTCSIAHVGIPPPDVCVGTPRWMAPEVLRAIHEHNNYGLEVDIWSFGCLLLEMLTLEVPYSKASEVEIHDHILSGKRPQLTNELEALGSLNEPAMVQSDAELKQTEEGDSVALVFLVDLFRRCTKENPVDRPTAQELYEMLLSRTNDLPAKDI